MNQLSVFSTTFWMILTDRKGGETEPDFLYLCGTTWCWQDGAVEDSRKSGSRVRNSDPDSGARQSAFRRHAEALIKCLCNTDTGFRKILKESPLKDEISLNFDGTKASVGPGKHYRADNMRRVLQAAKCPLLIVLDEAHMDDVRPDTLKSLMNAVQTVGWTKYQTALVLAGTPGLKDQFQLRQTQASYWIRGNRLPIGLLSPSAALRS